LGGLSALSTSALVIATLPSDLLALQQAPEWFIILLASTL